MSVPEEYLKLARKYGLTRRPGQSDEEFVQMIDNIRDNHALLAEAKRQGVSIPPHATSAELRRALCDRYAEILECRLAGAEDLVVRLRYGVTVRIQHIHEWHGELVIQYWIVEPWDRPNNRGRSTSQPAGKFLKRIE